MRFAFPYLPRARPAAALIVGIGVGLVACTGAIEPEPCRDPAAVSLTGGNCLVMTPDPRLDSQRTDIERIVRETVVAVRGLMDLTEVEIQIFAGTAGVIREIGIGGQSRTGRDVQITINPDFPDLEQSIATELFPLLAHELHHVMRIRTVGYGSTLLGAMVSEGLADQFAVEVAGIDPPRWSTALTGEELSTWTDQARDVWHQSDYGHDAWFFGTGPEIPRWAGYSIGFALTGNYLSAHPDARASRLFSEPAASFATGP